jgi:acyl-coenzyme A thioesterase THEM4
MVASKPCGIDFEPVRPDIRAALESIPWCAGLLSDPAFKPFSTLTRKRKPDTEYSFICRTLATDSTIPLWQAFYRTSGLDRAHIAEVCVILTFGSGMDGHAGIVHGGLIATVMDEILLLLAGLHKEPYGSGYTAYLKVDYKKPVPTPGTVLARALLESRSSGKKGWLKGSLEDGVGGVFATAECLVIGVLRPRPKL